MASDPPRPLLGDASCLRRPPSGEEARWYRRMAGIPWYRSITAITALVVMSEAGLLGVLVLVPRLFEVDALSSPARLLLVILPIVYALAVSAQY